MGCTTRSKEVPEERKPVVMVMMMMMMMMIKVLYSIFL
jgi:hypothetical protein